MIRYKGDKGEALVYKGENHDWIVDFWGTTKSGRHVIRIVHGPNAKPLSIILAKQMAGIW
jgi:hypothetical protein